MRRAFSLIELLVVIAILAVLIGLLLPAVQKVREAAARSKCSNNLRQIGLGFHNHHDTVGRLPRGGTQVPPALGANMNLTTPLARKAEWSWAYLLLPYIEQDQLYQEASSTTVGSTPIRIYYCPARRPARLYGGWAKIGFAGNAGTSPTGANGVVMQTTPTQPGIKLADITDGTSTTTLVAEKRMNVAMFGQSLDDNEPYCTSGWNEDWEVYRTAQTAPGADYRAPGDFSSPTNFGSSHPGVFNVVFCDGSVRTVRFSVTHTTWQRVCVRNDNLVFSFENL
jgi:prepilin-type N-terminal cleavage/methylation domain-containing protein/prepilin-type processing-associated H-X9-DG protein